MAEDAFISFRVVHNFVEGYGLRWDIDERVQVFTNPLWTLLHIPLYALTREVFYTTIVLGTALSTLTAGLLCAPPLENQTACKFYYGFVMPNTKLAKLDATGLSLSKRT